MSSRVDNRWLLKYSKNRFSQRGEDGILEKIFEILGVRTGWCVDVGAYGRTLSNTYALIERGWHGVLIEANEQRLLKLKKHHERAHRDTYCICAHVEPAGERSLDNLLKGVPLPKDFELLSIDIDGNEYYIWESLHNHSPLVVIIEFNPLVKYTDYLQAPNGMSGASLSYMVKLGREKGYELLSATSFNAIFVKKKVFPKFGIHNNSIEKIWTPDSGDLSQIPKVTKIVGFQSGHDVAYCVLENGIPILCEELERVTRKKMELGDGLKFFFSRYENPKDIDCFTFGNWGGRVEKRHRITGDKKSEERMFKILAPYVGQFYEFGHHLSHAANAFYTSNFDKALIITMDGGGREDDKTTTGFTISQGVKNKIKRLKIFHGPEANLGWVWHDMTKYVFGLSVGYPTGDQAGTVMAMATLGKPKYTKLMPNFRENLKELITLANKSEQEKFNVAASLQKYTETTFRRAVTPYIKGHKNLCVSGGVSLNCVLLGKIRTWFPEIKNIFADPVPYDAGAALGSARYLWHHILGNKRIKNQIQNMSPYLGKSYSQKDIENACSLLSNKIKVLKATDEEVLRKINDQKIVAVYGGRSETGRRALGNRSILADPRSPDMKVKINEKVKHRQWFRPVAPSILEEKVGYWFEEKVSSPYMSFAIKIKKNKRDKVPAVVHYDGTGRLQTVNKELNPWYYHFIKKWEKLTGIPILVNTSFNDTEPIVETPEDGLKCFLGTNIDYLYFFDYGILVSKL